jgi:hypothetical protein
MGCGLTRFGQVTLVLLATASTLLAQHAGLAGATSPGHAGGTLHSATPSVSGTPHFQPPAAPQPGRQGHWPIGTPNRPPVPSTGNRTHYPTVYAGYPWLVPYAYYGAPLAYGAPYADDGRDVENPAQQAEYGVEPPIDYSPEAPNTVAAANAPSPFRPAYEAPVEPPPVHAQPATTLIFKDGRPSAQVHNYALTGSTLYALDGESHQEIPLSEINIPATVEANQKAGVDFALPAQK